MDIELAKKLEKVATVSGFIFMALWLFVTIIPFFISAQTIDYEFQQVAMTLFLSPFFIICLVCLVLSLYFHEQSLTDEEKAEREARRKAAAEEAHQARLQALQPRTIVKEAPVTKETIIKEKVKVVYNIPNECPSCHAKISQREVAWIGPLKAKCPYCNAEFDAEEREI